MHLRFRNNWVNLNSNQGYIQVLTKSFPICFHIVGGICILCCAMWAPLPWILQRQRNANK